MAELLPCPKCNRKVLLTPQEGGRGAKSHTLYQVDCECGLHEENFALNTGKTRTAIAEWNRFAKAKRNESQNALQKGKRNDA